MRKSRLSHLPASELPNELTFQIGGFTGPSYSLRLAEGALEYIASDYGFEPVQSQTIQPSQDAWNRFRSQLDEIGVGGWGHEYSSEHQILDGTQWSLQIVYGDIKVKCVGDNAYPDEFDELLGAVERLIGGREFR